MAKKKAKGTAPGKQSASPEGDAAAEGKKKRQIASYTHEEQERPNNPPVGLVTPESDPVEPAKKRYAYDPHLDPQLVWAGKAERTSFEVPTVSLHVHERIDPKTILAAVRTNGDRAGPEQPAAKRQRSLFETTQHNPPLRDASTRSSYTLPAWEYAPPRQKNG